MNRSLKNSPCYYSPSEVRGGMQGVFQISVSKVPLPGRQPATFFLFLLLSRVFCTLLTSIRINIPFRTEVIQFGFIRVCSSVRLNYNIIFLFFYTNRQKSFNPDSEIRKINQIRLNLKIISDIIHKFNHVNLFL